MSLIYNPIALIFISYIVGAIVTTVLIKIDLIHYFANRNFINDKWTKRLCVLHFGWLIKNTFMRVFNQKVYLKGKRDRESVEILITEMTNAEVGHFIGFVFLLILNIYMFFIDINPLYGVVFGLLNIIFNLYLVFLQQYNKRRITKLFR